MTIQEILSLRPRASTLHPTPPLREREALLLYIFKKDGAWLLAHPEVRVHPSRAARFHRLAARLMRGEPLAHLLGEQWFYGRPFRVTRDVLIPRPETELLIELTLRQLATCNAQLTTIADVGTGSGCIAITLAAELPRARVIATDISPAALRIARTNAQRNGVTDHVTFLRGNLLTPLLSRTNTISDSFIILANPPYLTTAEWRALPRSIRAHEPRTALDAGLDGLDPYRSFFRQVYSLAAGGLQLIAFLEIDPRRHRALAALVRRMLPRWRATFHRDLTGRWRVLELQ